MKQLLALIILMCFTRHYSFSRTMNSFLPVSPEGTESTKPIYKFGAVGTIHNTGIFQSAAFLNYNSRSQINNKGVVRTDANRQLPFSSNMVKVILGQLGNGGMYCGAPLHVERKYGDISVNIENRLYCPMVTLSASTHNGRAFTISKGLNDNVLQDVYPAHAKAFILFLDFFGGDIDVAVSNTKDYCLAVSSKAVSTRFKVQQSGSWADFVIGKCYLLCILSEVEQTFAEKSTYPTCLLQVKEKEDLDVGTNHLLSLKKAEEITLYHSAK